MHQRLKKGPHMNQADRYLTTGFEHLDEVFKGILPGDNIVWQVDDIADYQAFVTPYCEAARLNNRKLVYFRFARHEQLLADDFGAEVHRLRPEDGFENFVTNIHQVIRDAGVGAFYVFDCLSDLAGDWYSDSMLGDFFQLTCPYLFDLETVTYFALLRGHHSSLATGPISDTTQLFLDVYRHESQLYVRPMKVLHRYSLTMHMLHAWKGEEFTPVSSSATVAEILAPQKWCGPHSDISTRSLWDRTFLGAEEILASLEPGQELPERGQALFQQMLRMIISRDPGMTELVRKYFTLRDVLDIHRRMIGTGLIGGKAVGMLLARKILIEARPRLGGLLETHDSFYIGSDVYCNYLVNNGVFWVRENQRDPATFLDGAEQARLRIRTGTFPQHMMEQFEQMLDYFGESPFIVRSSSILEDNYRNSFAGKYESVFCANQGPRSRRLDNLLAAMRHIYASTMSEHALRYRAQRDLLKLNEQMSLLVMRVSGGMHDRRFYPEMAGVGFSFNPYVWDKEIDPASGVLRLVFGLGTRAVDRVDDDYTRVVALNAPEKRVETDLEEIAQYAQRRVDYLDLQANQLVSDHFSDILPEESDVPLDMFATIDRPKGATRTGKKNWVLTFNNLFKKTNFAEDMREILQVLQKAYDHPVDIEYTANFVADRSYRINLLQCRPLQVQGTEVVDLPEVTAAPEDRMLEARGAVVGRSRLTNVDRFIYVVPSLYGALPIPERHEIARLLGKVNRAGGKEAGTVMLLGPGRWGTSSPSLGIPVTFADVNHVSVMCEIVTMHDNLVPDVSLGTHFFHELVEMNMLYLALYPERKECVMDLSFFEQSPNILLQLVPDAGKWEDVVRVFDATDASGGLPVVINANAIEQKVVCYRDRHPSA